MKVLFKSFYLYLLGVAAEGQRKALERAVNRYLEEGKPLSAKRLRKMSDRNYHLYKAFKTLETDIKRNLSYKPV